MQNNTACQHSVTPLALITQKSLKQGQLTANIHVQQLIAIFTAQ